MQDRDTARELSAMCGEYGVVSTSTGDTEGNQSRGAMSGSSSSGRSENRSEIKRALIKPDELMQDTRADEAFVLVRGAKPLRCGRAFGSAAPNGPAWCRPTASIATITPTGTPPSELAACSSGRCVLPSPPSSAGTLLNAYGGVLFLLCVAVAVWRLWRVDAGHRALHSRRATAAMPIGRTDAGSARACPASAAPRSLDRALAELDGMIGLAAVKAEVSN